MRNMIVAEILAHNTLMTSVLGSMVDEIGNACKLTCDTLISGGKVLIFGNGGSAADSQHFAAEISGRYKSERKALPAIALTTDTSAITAISNDFDFSKVFERQVEALSTSNDLLIGISTSGNSDNVISALKYGHDAKLRTLGLSGMNRGEMGNYCDVMLKVPSNDTARIQEVHALIIHIICQSIDDSFAC